MFHKEGYKILLIAFILFASANLITNHFSTEKWLIYSVFGITLVFFVIIAQFFRNPKRKTIENKDHILSPVDGKVVAIEEVQENEYFKDKRLQISVFMSPINVHVTRYPVSGKIVYSKYHPGKFLVAWHPKSSEENERTTVVVQSKSFGDILYRQIAGALAKRIVNYAKKEDVAVQGADSGFIKFGSRVDVFVPIGSNVAVELNQKVRGGETILVKK
ncbi:MAG: phosphatidylserine decarboxylase family protein [Bacteroidota bacterium]